jgi:D-arabinose 1-dehydrogenase-like Zn-dependent alcohol dehydrogenase
MKAVRLVEIGKPLQEQEILLPALGERDVLVRVHAAGICHSDVHYRDGVSPVGPLPLTPGHEVAGVIEAVGAGVAQSRLGERVCLHYLVTCGDCYYCSLGSEQFCPRGQMLGKHRDGGYAEYIAVPARNAVPLPAEIPFAQGAVLMCSSSTSYHALLRAGLRAGERLAVFGVGGLGMSALQLGRAMGALEIYAVDINPRKLALAESLGAIPVDASRADPVVEIQRLTGGRGVDVALELIGLPQVQSQAVRALGVFGRAVMVGITKVPFPVDSYHDLIGKEATVMGVDDHLAHELPMLLEYARRGQLDLSQVITRTVSLTAESVNRTLDDLARFGEGVRTVIEP